MVGVCNCIPTLVVMCMHAVCGQLNVTCALCVCFVLLFPRSGGRFLVDVFGCVLRVRLFVGLAMQSFRLCVLLYVSFQV